MLEIISQVPIGKVMKRVPVIGQAIGFTKVAIKVYNSTDPIQAVPRALIDIIIDCSPPQVKYPLECGALLVQIAVCVSAGPTPLSLGLAIGVGRQILEKKLLEG